MKILLTSGGTKIPIDRVRHIGNMSKGTFPTNIGIKGLSNHRWHLNFIYSEGSRAPHLIESDVMKSPPEEIYNKIIEKNLLLRKCAGYLPTTYKDFDSYVSVLHSQIGSFDPDVVVLAAAVSDYGTDPVNGKIRTGGDMTIQLKPLPKIISTIKQLKPSVKLVGFKLLVDSTDDELIDAAKQSIDKNGCDMVIANDLRDIKNSKHRVSIVTKNGVDVYSEDIASVVAQRISELTK